MDSPPPPPSSRHIHDDGQWKCAILVVNSNTFIHTILLRARGKQSSRVEVLLHVHPTKRRWMAEEKLPPTHPPIALQTNVRSANQRAKDRICLSSYLCARPLWMPTNQRRLRERKRRRRRLRSSRLNKDINVCHRIITVYGQKKRKALSYNINCAINFQPAPTNMVEVGDNKVLWCSDSGNIWSKFVRKQFSLLWLHIIN